jgi:hypothetical protein
MKKLRITISVPDGAPKGTAVLFGLAEVLKDIPPIASASDHPGRRVVAHAYELEDGVVSVTSCWLKART